MNTFDSVGRETRLRIYTVVKIVGYLVTFGIVVATAYGLPIPEAVSVGFGTLVAALVADLAGANITPPATTQGPLADPDEVEETRKALENRG